MSRAFSTICTRENESRIAPLSCPAERKSFLVDGAGTHAGLPIAGRRTALGKAIKGLLYGDRQIGISACQSAENAIE